MAITQISQIQQRRGLNQDLPQLASAEMGWSLDTRQLFIGNGTIAEGAPSVGLTEILTQYSDLLSVSSGYSFKGLTSGTQTQTGINLLNPVVRGIQAKLDDFVNVRDFGAVGDGSTDDTAAINRALANAFSVNQRALGLNHHPTIYFPAGNYYCTGTINVPPYSRLVGDGKTVSVLQTQSAIILVQFMDSFGQSGSNFGMLSSGVSPTGQEYHIENLGFINGAVTFVHPVVSIDGGTGFTFNNCMFAGILNETTAAYSGSPSLSLPTYNINRGSGIAAVCINNSSSHTAVKNVSFIQCDFLDNNYGVEINNDVIGVRIHDSYFNHQYRNVVVGSIVSSTSPTGIIISSSQFDYSAAEAIFCAAGVSGCTSSSNQFLNSGLADGEASSPIINPSRIAFSSVITYNSDGNYSIADIINRPSSDYVYFPNITVGSSDCYLIQKDRVINGRSTETHGRTVTLPDSASFVSAGVSSIPANYTNLVMKYALTHEGNNRTGQLDITCVGSTYVYEEDFVESGTTGVYFQANTSTGNIEYTSVSSGSYAQLTYTINYFTA